MEQLLNNLTAKLQSIGPAVIILSVMFALILKILGPRLPGMLRQNENSILEILLYAFLFGNVAVIVQWLMS